VEAIRKILFCLPLIAVGLLIGTELRAQGDGQDTIYLKNGNVFHGNIVEVIPDTAVLIQTEDGDFFAFEFNEIERIEKGEKFGGVGGSAGNINFFLGKKYLDKDDWEPFHKHDEWGILLDFKLEDEWPIFIAIDILHSEDEVKTTELNIGVRKIWDSPYHMHPFVGGGIAVIQAEIEGTPFDTPVSKNETGGGVWAGGGVYWTLGEHVNMGLDLRWSKARISRAFAETDVGGEHAGLIVGYHW
jgi:hypothetical protein